MATTKTLRLEKLTGTVGAEILDVDVERMREDDALPGAVMTALEENGILVFRGLGIDDETQVAFSRRLGELQQYPKSENPEVFVVSLDPKHAYSDYLKATVFWHMDDTPLEIPSKATMLSAKVLSATGGETEFASTFAAYDALSEEEKERLDGVRVLHSQVPVQTKVHDDPTEEQIAEWRSRGREHPLVWKQRSGRRSLVLGETMEQVIGLEPGESQALIDDLNERATRPDRVYRHHWTDGDSIIWDNRGVVHRVLPYDPSSHRELHRTTLVGDEPIQ